MPKIKAGRFLACTRVIVSAYVNPGELFKHKGRNFLRNLDFYAVSGQEILSGDKCVTWDIADFAIRINWISQNG